MEHGVRQRKESRGEGTFVTALPAARIKRCMPPSLSACLLLLPAAAAAAAAAVVSRQPLLLELLLQPLLCTVHLALQVEGAALLVGLEQVVVLLRATGGARGLDVGQSGDAA